LKTLTLAIYLLIGKYQALTFHMSVSSDNTFLWVPTNTNF
jgi:hypothetical protein